jgi:glutathione synthase/RimK-type ligase-like ATP-grasp enzyme
MIDDRRFELRVHAFSWIPQEQWRINKRHGPANQIAWNFAQGGHFSNVRSPNGYKVFREAKEIAAKILEIRSMEFGGVDLIVDNKMRVYFIEVNASPGFEDLNRQIYIDAFSKLKDMSAAQVRRLARK